MSSRSLFLSIIGYLIVGELVYLDDCVYDVYKNHSYNEPLQNVHSLVLEEYLS